jgi:hypothetical protein
MPQSKRAKKSNNQSGRSVGKNWSRLVREFAQSTRVAGNAEVLTNRADFEFPVPDWRLTQNPSSLRNNITWVQAKVQATQAISNSAPTEKNFLFSLSGFIDIAGLAGYFDQYCIHTVTVSVTPQFEGAGSTLYTFGTCVTAIDYDNVTNLGSLDQIEAFQSSQTFEMSAGQSIQRVLQPCVAPALYTTVGSGTLSGYGLARSWVDSANPGVPHYGFRSFFVTNTVSGNAVVYDIAAIIGFRNNT